ncbi:TetR family transcriptional regulator [Sandarakinorhabdus sp.]|uniref:TetR family transcriptional regulator n=1 Tax=Sandarakinorhabdus sp. TaxID=1916663 RepID=UPI0028ABD7D7|nr:TetR family transcriptional regulator [Sandarakinorhabdus sp.]
MTDAAAKNGRLHDADATRADILRVAATEFSAKGLAGARIDEIAEKTRSSKRMIYYYFGSKEELYRAVLEQSYGGIREAEADRHFEEMPALEALRAHVEHTLDYHLAHPEFVRLVMNENIHHAEHLGGVEGISERNRRVVASMQAIIDKGMAEGTFRDGLDPLELHLQVSSLCFYVVSNRYTIRTIFGLDMANPEVIARRRDAIVHTMLGAVRRD